MSEIFETKCPCCGAALEIDAESRTILSHREPRRSEIPADLRKAVEQIKADESTREERFRQGFETQKRQEEDLQKRFQGLLKKAKSGGPQKPGIRDIDLD